MKPSCYLEKLGAEKGSKMHGVKALVSAVHSAKPTKHLVGTRPAVDTGNTQLKERLYPSGAPSLGGEEKRGGEDRWTSKYSQKSGPQAIE